LIPPPWQTAPHLGQRHIQRKGVGGVGRCGEVLHLTFGSSTYRGVLSRLTPETVPHLLPFSAALLASVAVPMPLPGRHPMS